MESSNKVIVFLLIIILAVIIFFGINLINSNKNITGQSIKEVSEEIEVQTPEYTIEEQTPIEEPEENIKEEIIKEPEEFLTEKQFETFKVERLDQKSGQALIFYEINPEDIRCPIIEPGIIIFFDETKTYLGYDEFKQFLDENNIFHLLAFGGDNVEALQDIREQTGVAIMVKFGRSDNSTEPLYC